MSTHDPENYHGTMFCGFGGSCSGAAKAGLDCAFAIDNNDRVKARLIPGDDDDDSWQNGEEGVDWQWLERLPAIETREKNLKDGKGMVMDVHDFKPTDAHAAKYVTASPPCKRFSTSAETREEEDLAQIEMDDIIKNLGKIAISKALLVPGMEYYIMENVTGLLNKSNVDFLNDMVTMLEDAGFLVEYNIYNSWNLGCCQQRERVILIGSKKRRAGMLPIAPVGLKKPIFAEIMEDGKSQDSRDRLAESWWPQSTYATAFAKQERGAAKMKIIVPDKDEAVRLGWEPKALAAVSDVLPTIACNAGGGPTRKKWMVLPFEGHGFRNATLLEGLRAQGFDDKWLKNLPKNKSQAWSMIGNAVPRPLMFYIMKHLKELEAFHAGKLKNPPMCALPLPRNYVLESGGQRKAQPIFS